MSKKEDIIKKYNLRYDYSKLDFNKPITREHIDWDVYNNKFWFVDKVKAMKNPNPLYMKIIAEDKTMSAYMFLRINNEPIKLYPYQDLILNDKYRFKYFEAANQIGKLLKNSEKILTTKGWKDNGDLNVGDYVYDMHGKPTCVKKVFPHKNWNLYKITFNDGSVIHAGLEHLWICKTERERFVKKYTKKTKTWDNPNYGKWQILSTEEIIKKGKYNPETCARLRVSIPVTEPVQMEYKSFKIDPYCLGLMLGDGSLANGSYFTTGDEFLAVELDKRFYFNYTKTGNKFQGNVRHITKHLRSLNLYGTRSHTKFIPQEYLHSSINQRKQLLKGLMDTDGSVYGKYSTLEYCTTSKQLKDDFIQLINSLGCIVNKVTEKNPFYYNNNREKVFGKKAYSIRFRSLFNPFYLPRKAEKFKPIVAHKHERIIKSIKYSHKEDATCIMVDNSEHSYLATKDFIVTHNSISLDVDAVIDFVTDHNKEFNIAIISKTLPQSTHQMRRVKQFLNSMDIIDWRENKGGTDSMSVIELSFTDPNRLDKDGKPKIKYVNRIICCPATEAALGYDLHKEYLDEFEFWDDADYMHDQVLEPRTYGTKGDMTITTNPNGNDTKGAELTRIVLPNGTRKYHVYNFNFLDRPGNTEDELEAAKVGKTRQVIESTLLAIRSMSDRNYFSYDEIKRSEWKVDNPQLKLVGQQTFWFLDVGAKHDQSVLCGGYIEPDLHNSDLVHLYIPVIQAYPVGYPLSLVVGIDNENKDGWEYVKSVKEYLMENSNDTMPIFGVDVTGNSGIVPLCEAAGLSPIDVTFSGQKKSGMFQKFKYMMEKGLIHRIKHKDWEYQASHLIVKKSQRGYLMIHHENEDDLDDCMDSTAGLIEIAYGTDYTPASFVKL